MNLTEKLNIVLKKHTDLIFCGAIIHSDGKVTDKTGDFSKLEYEGLASSILGPYGSPEGNYQEAAQYEKDRKMLPRTVGQGNQFGLIDKPPFDYVVVVFGNKKSQILEHIKECRKIGQTIIEIFKEEG